jgi:hypothetical protein
MLYLITCFDAIGCQLNAFLDLEWSATILLQDKQSIRNKIMRIPSVVLGTLSFFGCFDHEVFAESPKPSPSVPVSTPNEIQRWQKFTTSLNEITKANWQEYLRGMAERTVKTGATFQQEWELALTRIGQVAGKEALVVWRKEDEAAQEFTKSWRGMVGWATMEPNAARKWWDELPSGEYKNQLAGAMTWGFAQAGETVLTDFFLGAPDWVQGKVGKDAVRALTANQDFNASARLVAEYAKKHPQPAQSLFTEVLKIRLNAAQLEQKPEVMADWLKPHLNQSYLNNSHLIQALQPWSETAPSAALEWICRQEWKAAPTPHAAAVSLAEIWAKRDFLSATDWVSKNTQSPALTSTIHGVARFLATVDLGEALGWVAVLPDAGQKLKLEAEIRSLAARKK